MNDLANRRSKPLPAGTPPLTAAEIDAYVASGEWEGRAGGYAIQGLGSSLVASVDGDLSNVIGLPVPLVASMIGRLQGSE